MSRSSAKWYAENREEINARRRARYANDPEYRARHLAGVAAYKDANPDKARAAVRRWHAEHAHNREYKAAWRAKNRDRVRAGARADAHRRRGAAFDPAWVDVLLTDPCAYCGMASGEIDHITPVILGGDGDWTNLTAACRSCNAKKNRRPLIVFMAER